MNTTKTFLRHLCVTAAVLTCISAGSIASAEAVPYDLEKFRPVLDDSKLQAPTSSPAKINRGDFEGAANEYFFLDDTGHYLTFTVTGDSKRSELRQLSGEWDTASSTPQRLVARVKVYVPETPGLEQYTFLQIHDTTNDPGSLNKPLIRITRRGDYRKTQDHLWAAIRTPADFDKPISLDNLATLNIDLGPRPEGFFDAEIRVQNSNMTVTIDGETKVDLDVSYWDGLDNYFKAGVYNQDPGTSKVEFESLMFLDSDDTPHFDTPAAEVAEPE
ncbi:MAG: polysaccharide lyase family 7 protein [Planctomycetota bacterium]